MSEKSKSIIKICKNCKKEFVASYPNVQICDECKKTYNKKETFCLECGKSIWSKNGKQKFCSTSCRSKYNARLYNPFKDENLKDIILNNRKKFYTDKDNEHYKESILKAKETRAKNAGSVEKSYKKQVEKRKQTNLEKHGDENYNNSNQISLTLNAKSEEDKKLSREKAKNTCIEKYGVSNYAKTQEYKDKLKKIFLDHYGVEHYVETDEYKEKTKQSILNKYGVDSYAKTKEYKELRRKQKENKIKELGYVSFNQSTFKPEYLNLLYNKEKSIDFVKDKKYSLKELTKIFEASETSILHWINRNDLRDYINWDDNHYEKEIQTYLKDNNIEFEIRNRKILEGLELDIYIPSKKIGIEFNGNYYHSSLFKEKNYHLDKAKKCEEKGIRLIQIWEYEWDDNKTKNKILSLLNIALNINPNKIYARECKIKQITNKEAKVFNNENHLQGHRNAQVTYGLFYKDKLVQLMSFSKSKWNKNLKDDSS